MQKLTLRFKFCPYVKPVGVSAGTGTASNFYKFMNFALYYINHRPEPKLGPHRFSPNGAGLRLYTTFL
jgi:hypothetical protein